MIEFSRVLNVASALLVIVGIMGVIFGLQDILIGPVESALYTQGDKLTLTYQFAGLYLLSLSLSLCIISLLPYRKGEKWAWYTVLVTFGFALLGQLVLVYIGTDLLPSYYLPASIIILIIWLSGLLLPVKEFFS